MSESVELLVLALTAFGGIALIAVMIGVLGRWTDKNREKNRQERNKREEAALKAIQDSVKNQIVFEEEERDVGRTKIRIILEDGTILYTHIYGHIQQHVDHGFRAYGNHQEPFISDASLVTSESEAKNYIQALNGSPQNFIDDPRDIKMSWHGSFRIAEIIDTEEYVQKVHIAKVVPK